MIIHNPTLKTYQLLNESHYTTLRCPCSKIAIPYDEFVSLSPTFHQICFSDLVDKSWISLLISQRTRGSVYAGWSDEASRYFQYLSTLCKLADQQTSDGIQRFLTRSIVTSDVLSEVELSAQLNNTVHQLIESMVTIFRLFIKISNSILQVDQLLPLQAKSTIVFNENTQQVPEVCLFFDSNSTYSLILERD